MAMIIPDVLMCAASHRSVTLHLVMRQIHPDLTSLEACLAGRLIV